MFLEEGLLREGNTEITLTGPDGLPKTLWQENVLGRLLRLSGLEVRIPFLTGQRTYVLRSHNLITNAGHAAANARMSGQGSYNAFVTLAIGIGTTAAAVTDTALVSEVTTNGGARGTATATQVTTSVTNDTTQLVKTWSFTGAFAVTEEGILDSATTGGTLLARQVFAAINIGIGDSLTFTHKYQS